jgi:predicted enzyme related to lactoylglutathione lyase
VSLPAFLGILAGFVLGTGWARYGKGEQEMKGPSWKVTGVGGVFFKARDPKALKAWYEKHLGLEPNEHGTILFWSTDRDSDDPVYTVWGPFSDDTDYFEPSTKPFMFNFRVRNLDGVLADLRAQGVPVDDRVETYPYGRFGWTIDPEGNRIELWEPAAGLKPEAR